MIWRLLGLCLAAIVGAVMLYLSPYWIFDLWGREGLFGFAELRPGGDLLNRWLRGTPFAPFAVLIWAVGVFLILTWTERFVGLFRQAD